MQMRDGNFSSSYRRRYILARNYPFLSCAEFDALILSNYRNVSSPDFNKGRSSKWFDTPLEPIEDSVKRFFASLRLSIEGIQMKRY
jgi:hypothetical protein